jgi:hypothetical protein
VGSHREQPETRGHTPEDVRERERERDYSAMRIQREPLFSVFGNMQTTPSLSCASLLQSCRLAQSISLFFFKKNYYYCYYYY